MASRVGTIARSMAISAPTPWSLDVGLSADLTRGNTNTTNARTTTLYVRNPGDWRFSGYLTGAYETSGGHLSNERFGSDVALARRLGPSTRLVGMEELVHAPLDGLSARNLLGGLVVWSTPDGAAVQMGLYGGAGWAQERYVGHLPDANYGAALAGANATAKLSPTATLAVVSSYTQDVVNAGHYSLGTTASLKSHVTALLGLELSYSLSYTHQPAGATRTTNQSASAGVTLAFKGAPAAGSQ